jgi:hypothetical protein
MDVHVAVAPSTLARRLRSTKLIRLVHIRIGCGHHRGREDGRCPASQCRPEVLRMILSRPQSPPGLPVRGRPGSPAARQPLRRGRRPPLPALEPRAPTPGPGPHPEEHARPAAPLPPAQGPPPRATCTATPGRAIMHTLLSTPDLTGSRGRLSPMTMRALTESRTTPARLDQRLTELTTPPTRLAKTTRTHLDHPRSSLQRRRPARTT